MAKQQRSVQLPGDIYAFCDAFELGKGVKFNRQVLAGLLKLLFADFDILVEPDSWITLAVQVERGSSISGMPMSLIRMTKYNCNTVLGALKSGNSHKIGNNWFHPEDITEVENILKRTKIIEMAWNLRHRAGESERDDVLYYIKGVMGQFEPRPGEDEMPGMQ